MRAALYLRSSKDRHDVSIQAQRRELEKLAGSRSLAIVATYEDAVESGSTENRPGFIELVRAIKNAHRGWETLLVYDTSRIARRRYIAQAIKHEAKKRGVVILYARLPADLDPVAELVLESVFEAMDEAHSLLSREKGLAGMAENVRAGWRAGGRAPLGYSLVSHATGAVRDGKPVTKSRLVYGAHAESIRRYLTQRAARSPRSRVLADLRLPWSPTTMIGVEWNALTYAGHTVWNRHAVQGTGRKRRPRSDWQVTRSTHAALISDAEAESILVQLETSDIGAAVSRAKAAMSPCLLTGLLFTDDGRMWVGHGRYYRLKSVGGVRGRLVRADLVDGAVLAQFDADWRSDLYLRKLLEAARRTRSADPAEVIEKRIGQLEREKARASELALTNDAPTFLALVADRSRQVEALRREAAAMRTDDSLSTYLGGLTVEALRERLAEQDASKRLQTLVERVVLEPSLTCRVQYKAIPGRSAWRSMASPGGFEPPLPP